jgi:hypothetical protein
LNKRQYGLQDKKIKGHDGKCTGGKSQKVKTSESMPEGVF